MSVRRVTVAVGLLAALLALGWLLTPASLDVATVANPDLPGDIDGYLAKAEASASQRYALVEGTQKRIRWQRDGERSEIAVVYLHGFSATRQEIAPTNEIVADRLGANLFETRLEGHGHGQMPMHEVRAEDWLADGVEAIGIGRAIGDRVVVIGTSTGATLALALAHHPVMADVDALVLISPNLGLTDSASEWLIRPGGTLIARWMLGDTLSWTAHNELQERYWTTSYPTAAVIEVMRLVARARPHAPERIDQALLMLLSPDDSVVSPAAARAAFERIDSPRKRLVEIDDAGDPSRHVLAGDILSPDTTEDVAALIVDFVLGAG